MIYAVVSRQRRYFANSWNLAMTSGQSEAYPPLFYPALYDTGAQHADQSATSQLTDCDQQCKKYPCTDPDKQCLGSNNVCYDYVKERCRDYTGFCWCGADLSKHNHMQSPYPHSFGQTGPPRLPWPFQGSVPYHTHAQKQGPTGISDEITWPWSPPDDPLLSHNHIVYLNSEGTPEAGPTSYDVSPPAESPTTAASHSTRQRCMRACEQTCG